MTTFAIVTTIASFVIFAGFVALSVVKFGWQKSYSSYAALWKRAVPLDTHTNLWSIVTVIVALLAAPAMIEMGASSPWQFLGFFAPVYLLVVAFTPEYQDQEGDDEETRKMRKKQRIVHYIGTTICATMSVAWMCGAGSVVFIILSLIAAWVAGIATKTIEKSLIFWAEMGMFLSVYATILI